MATGAAVRALLASLTLLAIAPGAAVAATTIVVFDADAANLTNQTSATFQFHDTARAPTFTCLLDSATPACHAGTPATVSGLSEGSHTFSVNANGGAPVTRRLYPWTVDLTPPTTQITGRPAVVFVRCPPMADLVQRTAV